MGEGAAPAGGGGAVSRPRAGVSGRPAVGAQEIGRTGVTRERGSPRIGVRHPVIDVHGPGRLLNDVKGAYQFGGD
ncbi:hypothetical protein GCM10010345_74320 [Streptomyces canarius]|uniref:Uncharacterized protein n=1 Tax=Streptomyces canarius TaxID=285453 RepID=A0ABQ3D7X4_9ACTN|nr:hypothetical protein GCM10010345_74320 [Streptomyces canarius]